MSYTKGTVDFVKVEVKTSTKGNEYGSASVKIGEQWFNAFAKKTDTGYKLLDKNKNEVLKGMEIEFMYETNDKGYHSIDTKTLLALMASPQPSQPNNTAHQAPSTTPQEKVAKKADMDGFCDGLAMMIAAYKFQGKQMPAQDQIDRVADYIKKLF